MLFSQITIQVSWNILLLFTHLALILWLSGVFFVHSSVQSKFKFETAWKVALTFLLQYLIYDFQ
jgi:hypothetical protein